MLPLTLDLTRLRLALVGAGMAGLRRLERLDAAGARALVVYAPWPSGALATQAGRRLVDRLPTDGEFAKAHFVFIAGLAARTAAALAERGRALGAIVHVEDTTAISDVRMPAVLHRGDLTIAVSTGSRSPGLAAALKRALGKLIGPEWGNRLDQTAAARCHWRAAGLDAAAIATRTDEWLAARRWLVSDAGLASHPAPGTATADTAEPASCAAHL